MSTRDILQMVVRRNTCRNQGNWDKAAIRVDVRGTAGSIVSLTGSVNRSEHWRTLRWRSVHGPPQTSYSQFCPKVTISMVYMKEAPEKWGLLRKTIGRTALEESTVRLLLRSLPRMALTALALGIVTPFFTAPLILLSLFTSSGWPSYKIAFWWAKSIKRCMGLTFSLHGAEKIVPGQSYIVTPNHQGNADILALLATLPTPFRWVVKKELLKIPVFGWALNRTGAISLDRSNREKAIKSLQSAKDKLTGGWSVLIYPEGTRSQDPHLQPFKKGAFMLAVQTGVPILPITCNGAYRILPKKTITFVPGHVTIHVGDPIATKGLTVDDVPDLMERTRAEMLKYLDPEYDPFTPPDSRAADSTLNVDATPRENRSSLS